MNHQGTAASRAREARAGDRSAADGEAEAAEFFDRLIGMSPRWLLTTGQRGRLAPAVAAALAGGWPPAALAEHVGANTAGIRNHGAVLAARLSPAELPPPPARRRPPWCGECDQVTRMLDFDGDAPRPCPRCKSGRADPSVVMRPGAQGWYVKDGNLVSGEPARAANEPAALSCATRG